jgi:branched-chain amino acid transport system permease protein
MKPLYSLGRLIASPWLMGVIVVGAMLAAGYVERGTLQMWSFLLTNILLAQSINLLTGVAGQISLGHAGFLALGAYASALVVDALPLPFPLAIVFSTAFVGLIGYLLSIPAGRVKEFYLAMMSLAFGLIVYELLRDWRGLTGGVMGMRGIPSPSLGTLSLFGIGVSVEWYFRLMLLSTVGVMFMLRNFMRSYLGRSFYAIHTSEVSAGSMGIAVGGTKRFAYTLSGALAGLAGGFYTFLNAYLTPESFTLMRSIEILVMSIVGGFGSLLGQVFGAAFFTYLPQTLQAFRDYQFIIYGVILLVSFTLLPRGIAGLLGFRSAYSCADRVSAADRPDMDQVLTGRQAGEVALRVEGVGMTFAGLRALDEVSLEIKRGSITGLIGPNGSGKSTLVNVISGIYQPTVGQVFWQEQDISDWPAHRVARLGIIRTFQDPHNVPNLTVRENVVMGAHRLYESGFAGVSTGLPGALAEERGFLSRADALLEVANISQYADEPIGDLPYGIQRLAEVIRALAGDPDILLLDEPAAGLSEAESECLIRVIRLASEHGIGVMLIDHHLDFLRELVDEVVVFDAGREIYRGSMTKMRKNPEVIAAYIGSDGDDHA